jgi:hypothetical protein
MSMKKAITLALFVCGFLLHTARAQTNLIPNGDFSDRTNPLARWRTDFPYEPWYVKNAGYVKIATDQKSKNGGKCIVIDLPEGVTGNEGGKIESAFIKVEPGATYRAEVDCMTWSLGAKIHTEVWVKDPLPDQKRDKFRTPALPQHGVPALLQVYRAQFRDPPGGSKKWDTASREFTVPQTVKVNLKGTQGAQSDWQNVPPEYLSMKVVVIGSGAAGKAYFSNFRIYKVSK